MDGDSQTLGWILFVIFVLINFVMYGFSAAIQNINESEVEKAAESGSRNAAKIIDIINNPTKLINTIQLNSVLMAMIGGFFALNIYGDRLHHVLLSVFPKYLSHTFLYIIALLIVGICLAFILRTFGILMPKRFGRRYAHRWGYGLVSISSTLMLVLSPLTGLISFLGNLVLRIFGIDPKEISENVTEEEIKSMVSEGHEQGVIDANEAEMIANIFELNDKEAQDIMTHRKNLEAVDGDLTLAEAVDQILTSSYSRFPVYEDDLDNIIGVLNFKDAMIVDDKEVMEHVKLKDIPNLLRKPFFIPETRNIDALFKDMQSNKVHLAVVIDEYGQTSGIISMEDVLEEIVGNILDEYDEEETNIVTSSENVYLIKGMTTLEEIEDTLNIDVNEDDYDTLNGYLISKLGRIPDEGETLDLCVDNCNYRILKVENKMIALVELTIIPNDLEAKEDPDEDNRD